MSCKHRRASIAGAIALACFVLLCVSPAHSGRYGRWNDRYVIRITLAHGGNRVFNFRKPITGSDFDTIASFGRESAGELIRDARRALAQRLRYNFETWNGDASENVVQCKVLGITLYDNANERKIQVVSDGGRSSGRSLRYNDYDRRR